MTRDQQAGRRRVSGAVSRWVERRANVRVKRKIRGGRGTFMGMDVLILRTVGRRSGQPRETPVTWFADGEDAWLVVAQGNGSRDPDWYLNMMGHPDRASIELPGRGAADVAPRVLDGAEREQAWQRITAAQPRYAKSQSKTDREFPVVRLTPR